MKKTKIQKLRLHKQKFLIKIVAWFTILTFLITLLFMGFPIISNASQLSWKIEDRYWTKSLFDSESMRSYVSSLNISLNDNYSNVYDHFPVSIDQYYDVVRDIFGMSLYMEGSSSASPASTGLAIFTVPNSSNIYVMYNINKVTVSANLNSGVKRYLISYGSTDVYVLGSNGLEWVNYQTLPNVNMAGIALDDLIWASCTVTFDYPNQNTNINYLLANNQTGYDSSGNGGGFDVPDPSPEDVVYPDGSGGTVDNNMYLKTADWKFNIPKYWGNVTSVYPQSQYISNWGQGNIYFYCLTNDFQKANASDFYLDFTFHVWISGHHFSDIDSSVNDNFYGSFNYNYVDIPLSNVTDGDNQVSFTVSDIFSHAVNSSGQSVNDFITSNDIKNYRAIDKWNWYVSCTAVLKSQSANNDSGSIVEQYNFISQVSKETGNTISDNSNPFYPDDMNPDDYPFNDTNSTDYSSNGSNIVINNNPNFTNNNNNDSNISNVVNGDGNPFNLLIDKLFGDGTVQNGSIGGTTQNQLLGMTGASRWLAVANDAMSWIPASVWAELSLFLTICLGVLVVGFILRIILDFL